MVEVDRSIDHMVLLEKPITCQILASAKAASSALHLLLPSVPHPPHRAERLPDIRGSHSKVYRPHFGTQ
jgi:hypothetical protein